jgi:hypothetical protein
MAITFPVNPSNGELYPNPVVSGVPQYRWDGTKWNAILASPAQQVLTLDRSFSGSEFAYTLWDYGTTTPFAPTPATNIVVFLGGVPQIPNVAYTINGSTITFTEPPASGTTFYATSSVFS